MTEWRNTGAKCHSAALGSTTFSNAKRLLVEMFAEWRFCCNHLGWLHCTTVHTQEQGLLGPSHVSPQHSHTVVGHVYLARI